MNNIYRNASNKSTENSDLLSLTAFLFTRYTPNFITIINYNNKLL